MKLAVLAVGTRMPGWVAKGWEDYSRRFPRPWSLELKTVAQGSGGPGREAQAEENRRLRKALSDNDWVVALEPEGRAWTTPRLAREMAAWQEASRRPVLVIGGADGLDDETLERSRQRWSLGPLTLPHMLARLIVAEQLYRGWSILANHPYHRP